MSTTIEINPFTATSSGGDVVGPGSSTDNAVARFDGTTGKLLQNSTVLVDDSGNITGVVALTASTSVTSPIVQGSTSASGSLTLKSTANATKGSINLGSSSAYDELNTRLGIGTTSPSYSLEVVAGNSGGINVQTDDFEPWVGSNLGTANAMWFENYRAIRLDISNGSSFFQFYDDPFSTVSTQLIARHTRNLWLTTDGSSVTKGVIVAGATGQTADLLQVQHVDTTVKMSVNVNGNVSIPVAARVGSTGAPTTSTALDVNSTTGALMVPRMTTTQKNALTAANGMIVYDSTLNKFQGYENGSWTSFI